MSDLNEKFKRAHKPNRRTEKQRFDQGWFIPKYHPEKWLTKMNRYMSSWELKVMDLLDRSERVVRCASEPIAIEYKNPMKNFDYCIKNNLDWKNPIYWKTALYYPDLWIELMQDDGTVRKIFIEIKPYNQSVAPKMPPPGSKVSAFRTYNKLAMDFLVNQQKWEAAKQFCEARGTEFCVMTEMTLKKLGLL